MTRKNFATSALTLSVAVALVIAAGLVAFALVYHAGHAYAAP